MLLLVRLFIQGSFKGGRSGGSGGGRRQNCSCSEQVGAVEVLKTTQGYEALRFRKMAGDKAMGGASKMHGCVERDGSSRSSNYDIIIGGVSFMDHHRGKEAKGA